MTTVPDDTDLNPPEEARVLVIGSPVDGGADLFEGSFSEACWMIWKQEPAARAELCIWTENRVYDPDELERMRESQPSLP